jgi:hypothetical protein
MSLYIELMDGHTIAFIEDEVCAMVEKGAKEAGITNKAWLTRAIMSVYLGKA